MFIHTCLKKCKYVCTCPSVKMYSKCVCVCVCVCVLCVCSRKHKCLCAHVQVWKCEPNVCVCACVCGERFYSLLPIFSYSFTKNTKKGTTIYISLTIQLTNNCPGTTSPLVPQQKLTWEFAEVGFLVETSVSIIPKRHRHRRERFQTHQFSGTVIHCFPWQQRNYSHTALFCIV